MSKKTDRANLNVPASEPVVTDTLPPEALEELKERAAINIAVAAGLNGEGKPEKVKETKAERFRRLAQRRVGKALDALTKVENLTNRVQYEWTDAQAVKIEGALSGAVGRIIDALQGTDSRSTTFTL